MCLPSSTSAAAHGPCPPGRWSASRGGTMDARVQRFGLLVLLVFMIQVDGRTAEERAMWEQASMGPPDLESIRTAGDAIRPLHVRKGRPMPGDWLDQHRERGQSFDEYRASDPNRPDEHRARIYLQPLGAFDATQKQLLQ